MGGRTTSNQHHCSSPRLCIYFHSVSLGLPRRLGLVVVIETGDGFGYMNEGSSRRGLHPAIIRTSHACSLIMFTQNNPSRILYDFNERLSCHPHSRPSCRRSCCFSHPSRPPPNNYVHKKTIHEQYPGIQL